MLKGAIQSLFGSQYPSPEPFHDVLLGELKPAETGWTVCVSKGEDSFEFTVGGMNRPDARLLAHARDIVSNYQSFKQAVRQSIESESRDYPEDANRELAKLEIDYICLPWPDRPDDGMIFFRGSANDIGLWRCDYIGRKAVGLARDT